MSEAPNPSSNQGIKMLGPYQSGFRDAIIEAKKRIAENGSVVGAATRRWFEEVIGGSALETSDEPSGE